MSALCLTLVGGSFHTRIPQATPFTRTCPFLNAQDSNEGDAKIIGKRTLQNGHLFLQKSKSIIFGAQSRELDGINERK